MKLAEYLNSAHLRGTPAQSCVVLLQQLLLTGVVLSCARAAPTTATVAWALTTVRSFLIFHDAGHGSFFQRCPGAPALNGVVLQISAALCATPTDWNKGHQLHHAHVGNLGQRVYDWGETVFHTKRQFLALSRPRQALWRAARHPVPFFALAPILTWFVRMRLPFEPRPNRRAAYRLVSKLTSTFLMACRYAAAYECGIFGVVFVGDYLAMVIGVALFHLQHVFDGGYARASEDWELRHAATSGSSLLLIPRPLKFFTLGIEYHHLHHFQPKIPGYMLQHAHENAPARFDDLPTGFGDVRTLGWKDVWRSLQMQCFDEERKTFAPFPRPSTTRRRLCF